MSGTAPTGEERAFLRPAGFSTFAGERIPDRQRVRALTFVFMRNLTHGLGRKLLLALALLPGLSVAAYALLRGWAGDKAAASAEPTIWTAMAVPADQQVAFLTQNMQMLFAFAVAWLLLVQVALVAPLIARDTRAGALILYFSRPIRRGHYLQARILAAVAVAALGLALPAWIALLGHMLGFGLQVEGTVFGPSGWVIWPLMLLAIGLASLLMSALSTLVALACGALMRNPSAAGLVLGGGLIGSVGISWVLQLVWGRNSLARAADLHHALTSPVRFATMAVDMADAPDFVVLDAAAGLGLWVLLAGGAWFALARFIADPPLGKGRT